MRATTTRLSILAIVTWLLSAGSAGATVNCSYTGGGCNAGYSATASFTCISSSLLKVVINNTSTVDDSGSPSNNVISSLTFDGASPVASSSDSATVAAGSSVLNGGSYTDCSGVTGGVGTDITCEWSAGSNYCPEAPTCTGSDTMNNCFAPLSQCGLGFVSSRESSDVNCDSTNNFTLATTGDIDGQPDGPDWGVINAPTQTVPGSGNEVIDDTVEVVVDVGTCVETSDFCTGCATYGSHFRHACGGAQPTPTPAPTPTPPAETPTPPAETPTPPAETPTPPAETPTPPAETPTPPAETPTPPAETPTPPAETPTPTPIVVTPTPLEFTPTPAPTETPVVTPSPSPGPIRKDPARIVLRPDPNLDYMTVHGLIDTGPNFDPSTTYAGIRLQNESTVIYEADLAAGDLRTKTGKNFIFTDRNARRGLGGTGIALYKIKKRPSPRPASITVKVFGDLSAATLSRMTITVWIGNDRFHNVSTWRQLRNGWFLADSNFAR